MKRNVIVILLVCLIFGLVSCAQSTTPAVVPTETKPPQPVDLTFWHSMDGVYAEIVNKQVDTFNSTIGAEKGIKVTAVFQDWPGTDALTAAMSSDDIQNMPDVIQLYSESVSLIRSYERTEWLEDYINLPDNSVKKADLIPNTVEAYSIDGKMIGVPYNISALLLYYNKTYLTASGYTEPPKTISEMADMLPVLTDKTDAEFGLNVRVNNYELENWITTQGLNGSYFGNNNGGHNGYMTALQATDDGTLMKFLTEWKKVIDSGAYKAVRDSINEEFAAGMHAMVIMTSSRIPTIETLVNGAFDWDVAPIPKVDSTDAGGAFPSGGGLFMLDRGDEAKKAAAWVFIQYLISPEAQTMWLEGTGYIPVNIHAKDTDSYKAIVADQPRLNTAFETLLNSPKNEVASFTPNSSDVDTTIKNAMLLFADGTATLEETYTAIVDGCQQAFDDYYRANPIK
jgi:sn-glycerol 3-phosphate transport system substrate-binding protein